MKSWLLLDMNYLARRAWHVHRGLEFQDLKTGVIFGVLKDIIALQDRFCDAGFVFCFDRRPLHREADYPEYKQNRHKTNWTEEEAELEKCYQLQLNGLRKQHLKELGYRNIFHCKGYEADDIIASIVLNNFSPKIQYTIVSSDSDLLQLLSPTVSLWNPRNQTLTTEAGFSREWGISPTQWVDCKAIAGCKTDGIKGVAKGVGEKTAAKFLNGSIDTASKAFDAIVKGNKIWRRNRHLVKLPYPGTPVFDLHPNNVSGHSWQQLAAKLGMRSIKDKPPKAKKKKGFGIV